MADEKVKVVIAFDPEDRSREGQTVELDPAEAHNLVYNGRAAYAEKTGKGKGGNTNNAGS